MTEVVMTQGEVHTYFNPSHCKPKLLNVGNDESAIVRMCKCTFTNKNWMVYLCQRVPRWLRSTLMHVKYCCTYFKFGSVFDHTFLPWYPWIPGSPCKCQAQEKENQTSIELNWLNPLSLEKAWTQRLKRTHFVKCSCFVLMRYYIFIPFGNC